MLNLLKDYYKLIIPFLFIIILSLSFYTFYFLSQKDYSLALEEETNPLEIVKPEPATPAPKVNYYGVDIKGSILNPGVYLVKEGSRVIDVIEEAGGLTKGASTTYVNLSKKIFDEMVIKIYTKVEINNIQKKLKEEALLLTELAASPNDALIKEEDLTSSSNNSEESPPVSNLISINQATIEQLTTLPGIGEVKAVAIIKYREENGPFKALEELTLVNGIGESTFVKIKDYITL